MGVEVITDVACLRFMYFYKEHRLQLQADTLAHI